MAQGRGRIGHLRRHSMTLGSDCIGGVKECSSFGGMVQSIQMRVFYVMETEEICYGSASTSHTLLNVQL